MTTLNETASNEVKFTSLYDQINALITRIENLDQPGEAATLEDIRVEVNFEPDNDGTLALWRKSADDDMRRVYRNEAKLDEVFPERDKSLRNDLKQWLSDRFRKEHERWVTREEERFLRERVREMSAAKKAGRDSGTAEDFVAPAFEEWGPGNVHLYATAGALTILLIELFGRYDGEKTPVLTRGLDRLMHRAIYANVYMRAGEFGAADRIIS